MKASKTMKFELFNIIIAFKSPLILDGHGPSCSFVVGVNRVQDALDSS